MRFDLDELPPLWAAHRAGSVWVVITHPDDDGAPAHRTVFPAEALIYRAEQRRHLLGRKTVTGTQKWQT